MARHEFDELIIETKLDLISLLKDEFIIRQGWGVGVDTFSYLGFHIRYKVQTDRNVKIIAWAIDQWGVCYSSRRNLIGFYISRIIRIAIDKIKEIVKLNDCNAIFHHNLIRLTRNEEISLIDNIERRFNGG